MKINTNGKNKEELIKMLKGAITMCESDNWTLDDFSFCMKNDVQENWTDFGRHCEPVLKGRTMDISIAWRVNR